MAKSKKAAPPPVPEARTEWDDFRDSVKGVTDGGKLSKAMAMLRNTKFQLYADVQPEFVCGVVRSQSSDKRVYACRLANDGKYSCCTQNLIKCVVSGGSLCKHLLVLVVGLTKAGKLDPAIASNWVAASAAHKPAFNKEAASETFLKYKGAEAGDIDWRPTETVPEDFYSA